MTWNKLPLYEGKIVQGCLSCLPVQKIAPMGMLVGVGFGVAQVTRGHDLIFSEGRDIDHNVYWPGLREVVSPEQEGFPSVEDIEKLAVDDPDHDWRIELSAPLRGRTYQRHASDKWVLIESNRGFA